MKYLKITVIAFAIATVVAAVSVQARQYGIAGLAIPNFDGIASTGNVDKDTFNVQRFDLADCIENGTGKYTPVKVRTFNVNYLTYSNWKEQVKNQGVVIDSNKNNHPGTYRLNATAVPTDHWLGSKLYGTWLLD